MKENDKGGVDSGMGMVCVGGGGGRMGGLHLREK